MQISEKDYQDHLDYVAGIFTLGGLSECGKTTAGYRFQSFGIRKSKIVQIEHDMMRERGINPEDGLTPDDYENLYKENPDKAFKEFLFRLIQKMKEEQFKYASLESLYRAPLGAFIKKELGSRAANIYIDAPVEARAKRELEKINAKALEIGNPLITLDEMIQRVNEKDAFKMERKATDVKNIADYIVDNGNDTSKKMFLQQIYTIAEQMGVVISVK